MPPAPALLARSLAASLLLAAAPPLAGGCTRPRGGPAGAAPSASASASSSAPASSASSSAPPPAPRYRVASPLDAAFQGDRLYVAALDRADPSRVWVASYPVDGGPASSGARSLPAPPPAPPDVDDPGARPAPPARPASIDVLASAGGLVVLVDTGESAWQGLRAAGSGGLASASWEPLEASSCATQSRLHSLARRAGALEALERGFEPGGAPAVVRAIPGEVSPTLLCGQTRAFLVRDDGPRRLASVLGPGAPVEVPLLGAEGGSGDDRGASLQVEGDRLLLARIDAKGAFVLHSWGGEAKEPPSHLRSSVRFADTASLELMLLSDDQIALVTTRAVPAARPCKSDEDTDAVAELTLLDRKTGKPLREHERLDRWTCGADPGPFWGGLSAGRFVVSWPRGADAACARLGVRHGGLSYVVVEKGPLRAVRVDAPAEELADGGCDGQRCAAVAVGRGEPGQCAAAGSESSGEPRVIFYP